LNRQERSAWLEETVEQAVEDLEFAMNAGHTQRFLDVLDFYHRFRKYSLANTMLIQLQRPDATQCAGFRAWEKQGYHVNEGEKAIWVRGPLLKKTVDDLTGEIEQRLIGYIALAVFDVSQLVENVEVPQARYPLDGDYETLYLNARCAIGATGVMVDEEPLPTWIHGMSMDGRIVINPAISTSEKFVCLLHEAGHNVLNHHDRHEETTKQQRELCAEAVSYLLTKLYGLENPFSADYILHFQGTVEKLHESLTEIHLAVRKIADLLHIAEPEEQAA